MAIATYSDLQSAISDYLARSDLAARVPDFITLAESRMNRVLRTRDMETSASVELTSGSGSLPSGYLEWISATWVGTRTQDLRYCEPNSEEWRVRYRPNGDPTMFSIIAGTLKIKPVASGSVTLVYYTSIPALASNSTNWLLTRSPDLYLINSLAEAYIYTKNAPAAAALIDLARDETQKATLDGDSNKVARRPSREAEIKDIVSNASEAAGL